MVFIRYPMRQFVGGEGNVWLIKNLQLFDFHENKAYKIVAIDRIHNFKYQYINFHSLIIYTYYSFECRVLTSFLKWLWRQI